jgi:hypothetical protein
VARRLGHKYGQTPEWTQPKRTPLKGRRSRGNAPIRRSAAGSPEPCGTSARQASEDPVAEMLRREAILRREVEVERERAADAKFGVLTESDRAMVERLHEGDRGVVLHGGRRSLGFGVAHLHAVHNVPDRLDAKPTECEWHWTPPPHPPIRITWGPAMLRQPYAIRYQWRETLRSDRRLPTADPEGTSPLASTMRAARGRGPRQQQSSPVRSSPVRQQGRRMAAKRPDMPPNAAVRLCFKPAVPANLFRCITGPQRHLIILAHWQAVTNSSVIANPGQQRGRKFRNYTAAGLGQEMSSLSSLDGLTDLS